MKLDVITALLGLPAAIYGAVEGGTKIWVWANDIRRHRSGKVPFVILRTHVKYIMWEKYSEMIKLRQIRTLERVRQLKLDRYPRAGMFGQVQQRPVQDFYALPGTASQQAEFFVINLEPEDEFEARKEYSLVFGYSVPVPLSDLHPNENEEGLDVRGPLGKELNLEVHLPKTRRFGNERNVRIYAVYDGDREELLPRGDHGYGLSIDKAFKNTDLGRETDVLRFKIRPPADALSIRVIWPWCQT